MMLKPLPFKSIVLGALAAAMLAPAASALSCMRPDIARTMEWAKASDDLYYVLVGTFETTPMPNLPLRRYPDNPNLPLNGIGDYTVQSWFDGIILAASPHLDRQVTRMPIVVSVTCGGAWCGSAPANDREYIAFVKARAGQSMELASGPCPDKLHGVVPGQQQVEIVRSCFDKSCASDKPQ